MIAPTHNFLLFMGVRAPITVSPSGTALESRKGETACPPPPTSPTQRGPPPPQTPPQTLPAMAHRAQTQGRVLTHRSPSLPDLGSSRRTPYVNASSHDVLREAVHQEEAEAPKFDFRADPEPQEPSRTPHGAQARHSATSSVDQRSNLSVIDMYGDAESFISTTSVEPPAQPQQTEASHAIYKALSDRVEQPPTTPGPPAASVHDLYTLESSRKSASRIRLSIEEAQTTISSNRDRYGFKKKSNFVTEDQYNEWWVDYSKHCARRKKKWEGLMNKNGLSIANDSPVRFPARSEKLKRYIRKGIPAEWRGNAWWYFAKGPEMLKNNVGVYDSLVESTSTLHNKDTEIIERDLNRTFPDNVHFRPDNADPLQQPPLETPLIQALRRVLVAFSTYNPAIGYCQSMNFIAGLLLIFMDEEKTFWMLVVITSRYLPGVHDINLEGVSVDQGVLMLSLQEFLPDTWDKISKINFDDPLRPTRTHGKTKINHDFLLKLPPITLCTSSWFMSAFIGTLPIETTLRVWDCFFYEESSFLFKTALSIFKIMEPKVLSINDEMEVFQIVQNIPKGLIEPSVIFDLIFKKRLRFTNLTQDEVIRCRKYVTDKRKKAKTEQTTETDATFNRKLLSEPLWQPDIYGFKKGLPGVHWNRNLSVKMRSRSRRSK